MADSNIDIILLTSRWFHLAAAILALGGAAFQRLALLPAMGSAVSEAVRADLRESVRRRWARVVHVCIVILLLTGGLNFVLLALPPKIEPMPYHAIFSFKFFAALGVFFIASILVGRGQGFSKLRANPKTSLSVLLLLGAIIVFLSGILNQVRTAASRASTAEMRLE